MRQREDLGDLEARRLSAARLAGAVTTSGGIAPKYATDKPGELFVFGWSRYRDSLTLSPVKGAISPQAFPGRPWRVLSPPRLGQASVCVGVGPAPARDDE